MASELLSLADASALIHRVWPPQPASAADSPEAVAHEARRFAALLLVARQAGRLADSRTKMSDVGSAVAVALGRRHWPPIPTRKAKGLLCPDVLRADARFELSPDESLISGGGGAGQESVRLNLRLLALPPAEAARLGAGGPPWWPAPGGAVVRPGASMCRQWRLNRRCPGAASQACPHSHPPPDSAWALFDDGAPVPRPAPPFSGKGGGGPSAGGGGGSSAAASSSPPAAAAAGPSASPAALLAPTGAPLQLLPPGDPALDDEGHVPAVLTWSDLSRQRGAVSARPPARQALAAALERVWDPRAGKEQYMLAVLARLIVSAALAMPQGGGPACAGPPDGTPPIPGGHGAALDDGGPGGGVGGGGGGSARALPAAAFATRAGGEVVARVIMAAVGMELRDAWRRQRLYDFEAKPYASLSALVEEHELTGFLVLDPLPVAGGGARCVGLRLTALFGGPGAPAKSGSRNAVDGLATWFGEMLEGAWPAGEPRGDRREIALRAVSAWAGRRGGKSSAGGGGSGRGGSGAAASEGAPLVRELLGACVPAIAFAGRAGAAAATPPPPGLSPLRFRVATSAAEEAGLSAGGPALKGGAGQPAYYGRAVAGTGGALQLVRLGPDWISDGRAEEGVCVQLNLRRLAALVARGGQQRVSSASAGGGGGVASGSAGGVGSAGGGIGSAGGAGPASVYAGSAGGVRAALQAEADEEDEGDEDEDDDEEEGAEGPCGIESGAEEEEGNNDDDDDGDEGGDDDDDLDEESAQQLETLARLRGLSGAGAAGSGGGRQGNGTGGGGGGGSGARTNNTNSSGGGGGAPSSSAAPAPSSSGAPHPPSSTRAWDAPQGWPSPSFEPMARAEAAVRLVSRPDAADAGGGGWPSSSSSPATGPAADARAMLELQQHLAIVPLFSAFVPCWKGRAQIMCVFCPHAPAGGGAPAMPATVYLLDVSASRRHLAAAVAAVRPALEDDCTATVLCGSREWLMQADAALAAGSGGGGSPPLRPRCVLDVQQMRALEVQLRRHAAASGGGASSSSAAPPAAPPHPASLRQLALWAGVYHPVRHDPRTAGGVRLWQERPLPPDCVECGAADAIFLVLVCEWILPLLQRAAAAAAAAVARAGGAPIPALGNVAPAVPARAPAALAAIVAPAGSPADLVWDRARAAAGHPDLAQVLAQ